YDQSIMIEAFLLAQRLPGRGSAYAERARALAERLDPFFWDEALGGYDLEAGIPQVFPAYSAWVNQGLLALYQDSNNRRWLTRAAANVDALNSAAWDRANGGYFHRYYVCRDRIPPGCASGAGRAVDDTEKHLVDQAWLQRTQAQLAMALLLRSAPAQLPR